MIVATAGHVDHGKSTLVKALTGIETDRLAEEKRRGLSIDLGFAYHDIDGRRFGFVDVPGHERFIRNMLSGVSAIDAALLVVAADDGVMPQSIEHFEILRLLGIPTGVIAITKVDIVEAERIAEVEEEIESLVAGSFLEGRPVIPVDGLTGTGMAELEAALAALPERNRGAAVERATRMTIDRSFIIQGVGLTLTGTVVDGEVRLGDRLRIVPGGQTARVRGIRALDQTRETAQAGERCALAITGAERADVGRGHWLVAADSDMTTQRVDVRFEAIGETRLPRRQMPVHAHVGASHALARLSVLDSDDPREGALCQIVIDAELPLRFDDRIVLRDAADRHTIGCGRVIDPAAPARGRQRPERLALLRAMDTPDPERALAGALASSPAGVRFDELLSGRGLPPRRRGELVERAGRIYRAGNVELLVSHERFAALRNALLEAVDRWHKASPHTGGIRLNQLQQVTARSFPRGSTALLAAIIDDCVAAGELSRAGGIHRRPGHAPALAGADRELWEKVKPILAEARQPPVTREIAQRLGIGHDALLAFFGRIAALGLTVKLADNRYFLPETIDELLDVVRSVAAADPNGHITPIAFRDASGIGRNLAIAVLEYLDGKGITRRHGDYRVLTGLRD